MDSGSKRLDIRVQIVIQQRENRDKWRSTSFTLERGQCIDLITDQVEAVCLAETETFPEDFRRVALSQRIVGISQDNRFDALGVRILMVCCFQSIHDIYLCS
jgi:hypothetical protein